MIKHIKYENLSDEIKQEIDTFKTEKKYEMDTALDHWFKDEFENWLIERYGISDTKRKHFRLDVELPIKIIDTLIESTGEDKDAMNLVGKVLNISKGGLYFRYSAPIELSSIIKVVIELKSEKGPTTEIEALAMVVRADKLEEKIYGIGVMFSSLQNTNKESLEVFILKNLAYHLYPGAEA